ncbi:SRPBCC family protein [Massilia antarctica]|uniref:SRPBCC family protein n=1 Tax=Massilia antarctica TaxID=2765360 RepID=UPI00226E92C9|nr:SRPBCC family protein [Massilia sp. H27-R4]MCY0912564.1 SRPBCC family protein [Massilia sp. H27-R4]
MKQMSEHDLHLGKWLGGAALGALAMYMMDPDRGGPRRIRSAERLRELAHQGGDLLDKVVQEVGERMGASGARSGGQASAGATAQGAANSRQATAAKDDLAERRSSPARSLWPASPRNAAMPGGGLPGLAGQLTRRMPLAAAIGVAGAALLIRSLGNGAWPGLARQQGRGDTTEIDKTIRIEAAPEQVYELWANYDNFPRFMANVIAVRELGQCRSHWVVRGAAGSEFELDAVLTEQVRPRRLAWRSAPGAEVEQSGAVRFEPSQGGTLVTVRLSYRPPAGALGKAVATLFGANPEQELEEDLNRMKHLLEDGPPQGEAKQTHENTTFQQE